MRFLKPLAIASFLLIATSTTAMAGQISLSEWAVNIDGTVSDFRPPPSGFPIGVSVGGFNQTTGLGTIGVAVTGAGAHFVLAFLDLDINEGVPATNTFFDEFGAVSLAPLPAGLSWEIDEPGFVFGDIYNNFSANTLDNSLLASPDDISVALGWNFTLVAGQQATLTFRVSETAPASGFYLRHTDPGDGTGPESLYYSTSLVTIGTQSGSDVPEPANTVLLTAISVALGFARFRKARA